MTICNDGHSVWFGPWISQNASEHFDLYLSSLSSSLSPMQKCTLCRPITAMFAKTCWRLVVIPTDIEFVGHFQAVGTLCRATICGWPYCGPSAAGDSIVFSATALDSTETAIIRVISDLLDAVDRDDAAILVLLDLSAAFDTVDHRI